MLMKLDKALKELANSIENEILRRLRSHIGINPRTGTNTLEGSELERSIKVSTDNVDTVTLELADYYEYVVLGWRRTGRFPNTTLQFINNIMDWVRRNNVHLGDLTANDIAWVLYRKMIIEGREIAPRPFIEYSEEGDMEVMLPFLDDFFEKWAEDLFEAILNEIKIFR